MTSEAIRLRPPEREDLEFLRDLSNDEVVRRNVVGWDWPLSKAGQESWFASADANRKTRRFIIETTDGMRVGVTGLWEIDWHSRHALSSIKLGANSAARGRGFGTAALQLMMEFAFNDVGLNRLHTTIIAGNEASLAIYRDKSGWREEGVLREHVWRDGKFVDLIQLGITRSDYDTWSELH